MFLQPVIMITTVLIVYGMIVYDTARQAATSCKSPDNYSWLVLVNI